MTLGMQDAVASVLSMAQAATASKASRVHNWCSGVGVRGVRWEALLRLLAAAANG